METTNSSNIIESAIFSKHERVVVDHFIRILGVNFEVNDLYETLHELSSSDIEITNKQMAEVLMKLGIIKHPGNSRALSSAEVADKVLLQQLIDKLEQYIFKS